MLTSLSSQTDGDTRKRRLHNQWMPLPDRIKAARDAKGLSQAALGKLIGVSRVAVTQWESGETAPTHGKLPAIADALGVSVSDLLSDDAPLPPPRPSRAAPSPVARIPEVDVRGGMGGGGLMALEVNHVDEYGNTIAADNVKATWELPSDYLRHELRVSATKAYLVEVKGDSMEPTLTSGDRVMIDTADVVPAPGGVFAIWDGLGVVVKRLEHVPMSDPPVVRIISDNPHHGTYERTLEEVRIIGRAVWFGRRM